MRRYVISLVSVAIALVLATSGIALALPSETPDNTLMVNGPVRTIERVGNNIWVGGNFTQVQRRDGTVVDNVSNVAVFDRATGRYVDIARPLGAGSTTTNVRDIAVYGTNVVIGGDFPGPTTAQQNLVVFDGITGRVVRWYNSERLQTVLAAPDLRRIYGGGRTLSAFNFVTGNKHWSRAKVTVEPTHSHNLGAGYRDLERDGSTIWAACACDAVAGNRAKALIKLDLAGRHDASWVAEAGTDTFGISLVDTDNKLYLGAGGSDFLAEYPKGGGGKHSWSRDTSGQTQVVEVMDGQLVVGGHFWEVADQAGDQCGGGRSNNLDPNDECQTRKGLAAYSFGGDLKPWSPTLAGKYNLAWALQPDGTRLHVGGEFLTVDGVWQTYYARLS